MRLTFEPRGDGTVPPDRAVIRHRLTRNDRGQVESATGPFGTSAYAYDPRGYRIRRTAGGAVQQYHLEGENLESIYDGTGSLQAKFLRGSVIDEVVVGDYLDAAGKTTSYTFHHDALESVLALSGHAGSVEEKVTYAPFGGVLAQTGESPNALRYTGREFDADTGLYYYRARYYDPDLGRFLSPDPLGLGGGDVNLYAYAGNNPLRFNDPKGQCPWCVGAVVGAAIGAASGGATAYLTGGDVWQGVVVGGLSGLVIGGTLGAGTTYVVGALGASETTAAFAGGVASGYAGGFAGSAGPQAVEYGFDQVDWSIANNSGFGGAGVAVLPSLVAASASTATAVGGEALYSLAQQQVIAATLGFYDLAAGSATNVLFSEQLTQPVPTNGAPTELGFSALSTRGGNAGLLDSPYGK